MDDSFYRSSKVRRLGAQRVAAVGLWTLAGGWAADNLTDGFVPWEVIETWDKSHENAERLIAVGLWKSVRSHEGESGCLFHDWTDWQPTRDQVKRRRELDAERKARWRESRGESRRDTTRDGRAESRKESALPDPTRPDQEITTSAGQFYEGGSGGDLAAASPPRKRGRPPSQGTRIPDDFEVTPEMVTWAREHTPRVDGRIETDQFKDYWTAKSGKDATKKDWVATWRWWMRNAEKQAGGRNGHRKPTSEARYDEIQALRERLANKRDQLQLPRGSA